jgi:hypothetical protein
METAWNQDLKKLEDYENRIRSLEKEKALAQTAVKKLADQNQLLKQQLVVKDPVTKPSTPVPKVDVPNPTMSPIPNTPAQTPWRRFKEAEHDQLSMKDEELALHAEEEELVDYSDVFELRNDPQSFEEAQKTDRDCINVERLIHLVERKRSELASASKTTLPIPSELLLRGMHDKPLPRLVGYPVSF